MLWSCWFIITTSLCPFSCGIIRLLLHNSMFHWYKLFFVELELIFALYSAVFYNSFSRWSTLETVSSASSSHFLYTLSTFSFSFFYPLGGRWRLDIICFPAVAQALRWIRGICMRWRDKKRGWGVEDMLLLVLQMRTVGKGKGKDRRKKGA